MLPDSYFRDAWIMDNTYHIGIDIKIAKDLQRNKWRHAREKKLKDLDYQFMLALENNDLQKINKIKNLKQALRDVTLTQLPDEVDLIKNVWPVILNDDYVD
jgi:hypothetical protein